jgi:hypothetical protein
MSFRVRAEVAAGADRVSEDPRGLLCGTQPALLVRGSSVTDNCHAVPTRAYQPDYRRLPLTPAAPRALHPLDEPFHISSQG